MSPPTPVPESEPDPASHRQRRRTALGSLAATMLLWGSHGALAKSLVDRLPWPEVMALNIGWATLFLLVFCGVTGRLRQFRAHTAGQMARLAGAGLIGVFAYYFLLLWSFQTDRYAVQFQVLNYLFPVMTVLFSAALVRGERLTVRRLASVLVAFFGAYWVLTKGDVTSFRFTNWGGALAALGAAVCYGFFSAACKRMKFEAVTGQLIFFGASAIPAAAFLAVAPRLGFTLRLPAGNEWLRLMYVGIASNCLGTIFWFRAIRHGDTALMGSLIYLTLFVSITFFHFVLHEPIRSSALLGSGFVVAGAALASRSTGARNGRKPQ